MTTTRNTDYRRYFPQDAPELDSSRQRLSKLLKLRGYAACRESLVILEDHFKSSNYYADLVDFITKLNHYISHETNVGDCLITPDLAYQATKDLTSKSKSLRMDDRSAQSQSDTDDRHTQDNDCAIVETEIPENPIVRVSNVACEVDNETKLDSVWKNLDEFNKDDFDIHYNFLIKRLNFLPVFSGDYKIVQLSTLMGSRQPNIRCLCFGLLRKDISKIDGYELIDSSGTVPLKITPDTIFRNKLAYWNNLVLVEGVYVNPDDILYAANIGLPPILLDPISDKNLACKTNKMVILLKEIYLDDPDVVKDIDQLFMGYNSMDEPPLSFILIGDFLRDLPAKDEQDRLRRHMKKLAKIIIKCDNLRQSHIVIVPGPHDTIPLDTPQSNIMKAKKVMPKVPMTDNVACLRLLRNSGFKNVHLATNPAHIYIGDRLISVISHSYIKQIRNNLIHDLSDHKEEFYNNIQRIILSNAHMTAGLSKRFHSSLKLWHRPDLLILADSEAYGNRYDWSSSKQDDTSFATLPSFTRQSSQFKVYCMKSGEIEDSQVSHEADEEVDVQQLE